MIYNEQIGNVFKVGPEYYLAQCVASDYYLGAGIALQFVEKYDMRNKLRAVGTHKYPDCILIDNVFNLVTKKDSRGKPTYNTLRAALEMMRDLMIEKGITKIAMPKIGCGLDALDWNLVRNMLFEVFKGMDIDLQVRIKDKEGELYNE